MDEAVEIAFHGRRVGKVDGLVATRGGDGAATALLARCACCRGGCELEGDVLVVLLKDKYFGGEVSGLGCLWWRKGFNRGIDQEDVGEVIQLGLGDVGLLVNVSVEA